MGSTQRQCHFLTSRALSICLWLPGHAPPQALWTGGHCCGAWAHFAGPSSFPQRCTWRSFSAPSAGLSVVAGGCVWPSTFPNSSHSISLSLSWQLCWPQPCPDAPVYFLPSFLGLHLPLSPSVSVGLLSLSPSLSVSPLKAS